MISLIAILGMNRAIGNNGGLLWRVPPDMAHFKKLTTGHPVIMGRKTFESIGRPLPDRTNIVLSRNQDYHPEGCLVCSSIEQAMSDTSEKEIFIIGGGEIYQQTIHLADRLYLTAVQDSPDADTFFPDYSEFTKVISDEPNEINGLQYRFITLER